MKDLNVVNDALIFKWWWQFFTRQDLQWRKLVKALYYYRRKPLREGKYFKLALKW